MNHPQSGTSTEVYESLGVATARTVALRLVSPSGRIVKTPTSRPGRYDREHSYRTEKSKNGRTPYPEGHTRTIRGHAMRVLELIVRGGESNSDALDCSYFLGTTAAPILVAAHHHGRRARNMANAHRLLEEHLQALAQILGKETGRKLESRFIRPAPK